ncbi:MAG TPA: right-handed parallel beta-helix repeat-containing protein [Polyangia bacterium]|nr:right-handed parallel beta-helix repeat-containing protein [Polyangia bacterium]
MTRGLSVLVGALVSTVVSRAGATTYHVATTGDDAAAGTADQPLRTIQACANLAQPGDTCTVHAGVYRETVTPPRSGTAAAPIVFQAAPGECATVSGADPLPLTWSPYSGSIAVAPTTASFIQLFANGAALNEARWPNADPADLVHMPRAAAGAGTDTSGLVATGAPPGDWTGAMVFVIPGQRWQSNTRRIAAYDQTTNHITFDSPIMPTKVVNGQTLPETAIYPRATDPYYLYGSLLALDSPGEWFLDTAAGNLYLWPPGGVDPSTLALESKQRLYAFDVQGRAYLDIVGFQVFAAAIRVQAADHCVVDGVRAQYVSALRETDAYDTIGDVPLLSGTNNTWKNSVIEQSAAAGLMVAGNDNVVENNIIHDVDTMVANHAGIDFDDPTASNQGNLVAHNTVYRAARGGIYLYGVKGSRALYNRVYDVALQTEDMGCIYTWGTDGAGTEIAYNEVSDIGCVYGTGIYLDDAVQRFIVHHNYIHDVSYYGGSFKNQNLFFNNTVLRAGVAPFNMNPNYQTGNWDAVDAAQVADNLHDDGVGMSVGLRPADVTDYGDFAALVPANGAWSHVVVPFSAFAQPTWAVAVPLEANQIGILEWTPMMPGTFDIRVDNVRLEGPAPLLLADFENGSTANALGGFFWGGSQDTLTALTIDAPGAGGVGQAAHLTGSLVVTDWALMNTTLAADAGPVDLSAYTGVSFDVLATGDFKLVGPTGLVPRQSANSICPLDANAQPTTACAIDQGQPFPPFTDGYAGAAPDLGAFESGVAPWTSGAFFADDPTSCTPPPDTTFTLPPSGPYPVTPDAGADAGTDGGMSGGGGDASPPVGNPAGGGGCSCALGGAPGGGGPWGALGALAVMAVSARARRAARRSCRPRPGGGRSSAA